jgi:hypothetical protein
MSNTEVELGVTLERRDIEFPIRDVFDRAHVMIRSLAPNARPGYRRITWGKRTEPTELRRPKIYQDPVQGRVYRPHTNCRILTTSETQNVGITDSRARQAGD